MKKRNLNFLLALLAALALVFAGACSDGSDDDGSAGGGNGDGNTPTLEDTTVYTTYTYTIDDDDAHSEERTGAEDATYLNSVALRFADLNAGGSSVAITVEYLVCTVCTNASHSDATGHTNGGDSHVSSTPTGYIDTTYTWTGTATYSYVEGAQDAADTITVTLPADSDSSNANATLTFTVDSDSGNLKLTGARNSDDTADLENYTVKGRDASGTEDSTGCDILDDSSTEGALDTSTNNTFSLATGN